MSQHSPEEKHGLFSKLKKPFRSHSRTPSANTADSTISSPTSTAANNDPYSHLPTPVRNVVESAYIEGQRKAEKETGKKVPRYGFAGFGTSRHAASSAATSSSSSSISSSDHIIKKAYAAGRRQHEVDSKSTGHSPNHVIAASSVGKLLTSPPRVNRKPVEKDPGGDFTNEKKPTDVINERDLISKGQGDQLDTIKGSNANTDTTGVTKENSYGVTENKNPAYANDALATQGTGVFFDPRDTQGGLYGDSEDQDYSEATRAQLAKNRNLKTKPSAYIEQEKRDEINNSIKNDAYKAGQHKGTRDAQIEESNSSGKDANATKIGANTDGTSGEEKQVDPSEVHEQNKSAYNDKGVVSATEEARKHHQKVFGGIAAGGATAAAATAAGSGSGNENAKDSTADSSSKGVDSTTAKQSSKGVDLTTGKNAPVASTGYPDSAGNTKGSSKPSEYTSDSGQNKDNLNTVAAAASAGAAAGAAALGVHQANDKKGGVNSSDSGAPGEGKTRGVDSTHGFATNQSKPLGSKEVSSSAFTNNRAEPAVGSGSSDNDKNRVLGTGAVAAGAGAGAAGIAGASGSKNSDSSKIDTTAGVPPSDKNFDYDHELAELDKKINATQHEIDQLHGKEGTSSGIAGVTKAPSGSKPKSTGIAGTGSSAAAINNDSHSPNKGKSGSDANASTAALYKEPFDDSNSDSLGAKGASVGKGATLGLAAAAATAAGYLGFSGKSDPKAIIDEAYQEGVKKGSYDAGKSTGDEEINTSGATQGQFRSLDPASNDPSSKRSGGIFGTASAFASNTLGLDSNSTLDDYEVIDKNDVSTGDDKVASSTKDPSSALNEDGSSKPGLLDGAKGAATAAVAVGAGALGYDKLSGSDGSPNTDYLKDKPELTNDSKYINNANSNLSTGAPKNVNSSSADKSVADDTVSSTSSSRGGLLDSAKYAVASAGAVAAGAFGYEAYNAATSDPEYINSVIDDAYEAGAEKAKNEQSIIQEAYEAGKSKATDDKKQSSTSSSAKREAIASPKLDDVHDNEGDAADEDNSNKSGVLGGVLGSAAAAVGYGGYKAAGSSPTSDGLARSTDSTNPDAGTIAASGTEKGPEYSDSKKDTVPNKDLAKESPSPSRSGGILSSFGWNRSSPKASSNDEKDTVVDKDLESENSDKSSNKGYLGAAVGAAGAAGAAIGLGKGNSSNTHDKSLLNEAEDQFDDVRKEPHHKTTKTVADNDTGNSSGDGVQEVPGLASHKGDDKDDSAKKGSTTSQPNQTEASVSSYNKKHGFKDDKRNLIEIAENADPELKDLEAHHGTNTLEQDPEEATGGKSGDVQDVPLNSYKNQNEFVRTGGKQGSLGDKAKTGAAAAGGAAAVAGASVAASKSNNKDDLDSSVSSSSSSYSSSNYSSKADVNENKGANSGSGMGIAGARSSKSANKTDIDQIKKDAYEAGKEKWTLDNKNASNGKDAYSNNAVSGTHKKDHGLPATETGAGAEVEGLDDHVKDKSINDNNSDKNSSSSVGKGVGFGALGGILGAVGYGSAKKGTSTENPNSNNAVSGDHQKDHALPASDTGGAIENESIEPVAAKKKEAVDDSYNNGLNKGAYSQGFEKGSYDAGKNKGNNDKGLGVAGAAGAAGTAGAAGSSLGSNSTSSKKLSKEDEKEFYSAGVKRGAYEAGQIKAAEDKSLADSQSSRDTAGAAGIGAGAGAAGASKSGVSSKGNDAPSDGLVVEVIGIKSRDSASKIAQKASRDLAEQGVDLTSGKLVINAETKEVYKVETDGSNKTHARDSFSGSPNAKNIAAGAGAGGLAGAGIASASGHQSPSDAQSKTITSDSIPPRNDFEGKGDPNLYHNEHEKAKERLSDAAREGTLGNVEPPYSGSASSSNYESSTKSGHGYGGALGAGALGAGALGAGALGAGALGRSDRGYHHETTGESTNLYGDGQPEFSKSNLDPAVASGASLAAKEAEAPQPDEENIPVTVQGSTNTQEAEAIAISTVEKLKAYPDALANVKQLKIDVSTGKVYNERGEELRIPSEDSTSTSKGLQSPPTTAASDDLQPPASTSRGKVDEYGSPDLSATGAGAGLAGLAGITGASYGQKSNDVTMSPKYNYGGDENFSNYGLDNSTPRSVSGGSDSHSQLPTIDVVGASTSEQEQISREVAGHIRKNPDVLPDSSKKLIVDAQTGIVVDGFGKEIPALSLKDPTYGASSQQQSKQSLQMPGSFVW